MADAHIAHSGTAVARPLRFTPAARPARGPQESAGDLARDLVGASSSMRAVFEAVTRMAPHARATLITGETGTGKSTIARAMHHLGPRRAGPFQIAAGAEAMREADGAATLFLSEVADLSREGQTALAHALALAGHLAPGEGPHVIAATERDLRRDIDAGHFRAELFYRLTAFEVHLPPLRERRDDIPALAARFLREAASRAGRPGQVLTAGAIRLLQDRPWPGNLRELRNVVERASVLGDGEALGEAAVRAALACGGAAVAASDAAPVAPSARLDDAQYQHVRAVLAAAKGNKTTAAAHLGVSRRALYRLIDRLERRAPSAAAAPAR